MAIAPRSAVLPPLKLLSAAQTLPLVSVKLAVPPDSTRMVPPGTGVLVRVGVFVGPVGVFVRVGVFVGLVPPGRLSLRRLKRKSLVNWPMKFSPPSRFQLESNMIGCQLTSCTQAVQLTPLLSR